MSGSACHVGRKMIMSHLYFEEMHCAISLLSIFLMFIATLVEYLKVESNRFPFANVFSVFRSIVLILLLREKALPIKLRLLIN